MQIFFCVNPNSLKYFSHIFKINFSSNKFLQDAKDVKTTIQDLRKNNSKMINSVFEIFFDIKINEKIRVEVFPDYFNLGAVNIEDRKILLGQKNRSKYFYLGLLVHEISHIYTYNNKGNTLINEIISMLLEYYIYDTLESKKINDIWKTKELDVFHKTAIKYTVKFYKHFKITIEEGSSIDIILPFIIKNVAKADINICPPKGLLANLHTIKKGKDYS